MSNIIPFNYESKQVRVIKDNEGNPWWIAKDVCDVLELTNVSMAVNGLDDDEKGVSKVYTPGGEQELLTVNEPGLYTLIIRSNKPEAKNFKRWVTHEVLPTIRRTGRYEITNLSEIDLIIKSAKALKKLELNVTEHNERLTSLEAKLHQNSGHTGYWTISAWCKLNNLNISLNEAMQKGRAAAKLSKEWGVDISKVSDERFGEVNSYREDVLEEIFSMSEVCS